MTEISSFNLFSWMLFYYKKDISFFLTDFSIHFDEELFCIIILLLVKEYEFIISFWRIFIN